MLTLSKKNTKEALLKKSKIEVLLKICRSVYVYAIEGAISIFQSNSYLALKSDLAILTSIKILLIAFVVTI